MPNTARIRKTLEKLEFLVIQDACRCRNHPLRPCCLPAAVWAEKEGCFTNTERRVNIVRKVQEPVGESKADFWIFNQLAKRFENGRKIHFPDTVEGAFNEMKQLSKGNTRTLDISGMTHQLIEDSCGIQWPFRKDQTLRFKRPVVKWREGLATFVHSDGVFQTKDGRANLIPLPFINNNEVPL